MAKAKSEAAEAVAPKKTQMVESALAALGDDATPSDMQPWIQSQYNTEIDKQMISSYASQIRKKRRGGKSGAVRVSGAANDAGSVSVRDITVIKGLIDHYGANELAGLIKVLAK
jgi:hypothetical protein